MNTTVASPVLQETVEVFRRWLHMPDPSSLFAAAGCIAANRIAGDPVWLLIVGPPGGGKSELIQSFNGLPHIHPASTLTEAALLSGTPKRDRDDESKGGLLRHIGEFGIIVAKDFTSILSMQRDERAKVLSALREIYDGAWTRHMGTDGGRTLHWSGRVGMLAGVTPTIDRHHGVMAAMGERFVFFRLPDMDVAEQARRSIAHAGKEIVMRAELAESVEALMRRDLPTPRELDEEEIDRLVALSSLVVRARSAVERDSYTREIELISAPEVPTRIIVVLKRLLGGMEAIGLDTETAWQVVTKIALDSMPQLRRQILELLEVESDPVETGVISEMLQYPTTTAKRGLEDLMVYDLIKRHSQGKGKADVWELSDWTRDRLSEMYHNAPSETACNLTRFVSLNSFWFSKRLYTHPDISGEVPAANGNGRVEDEFEPEIEWAEEHEEDLPF